MHESQILTGLDNYVVSPTVWSVREVGGAHSRTAHLDIKQLQQKRKCIILFTTYVIW